MRALRRLVVSLVPLLLVAACLSPAFLRADSNPPDWTTPFPPFRIMGNLYYVGSQDLAACLVATPQGLILINSNLSTSVPQIRHSVEALGFHFSDVRILLLSHAHFDHCAGSARVKQLTGAKYMVMDADVRDVETGGRSNFQYAGRPSMLYQPAKVDRVLHDGDEVRLGSTILVAHLTAGHTKGCTTWTMKVSSNGRVYDVVIVGSPNVNPGYKLNGNPKYPQIAADYTRQFETLRSLKCDVFLGAHGGYFGLEQKYAQMQKGGPNPFIDPAGYKAYIADRQQAFEKELARQTNQ